MSTELTVCLVGLGATLVGLVSGALLPNLPSWVPLLVALIGVALIVFALISHWIRPKGNLRRINDWTAWDKVDRFLLSQWAPLIHGLYPPSGDDKSYYDHFAEFRRLKLA